MRAAPVALAARIGDIARMQLSRGEIDRHEDAGTGGGGPELVERIPHCGVVAGLQVGVPGRRNQVGAAMVER
jgi:hypothetical protein